MKTINASLINPSDGKTIAPIAVAEHAADPLKKLSDVKKMCSYFEENSKYRDLFLWIVGINTGLRVSDILRLRWIDLIDEKSYCWRDEIVIQEKKTARTKKRAVNRHISINESIQNAGLKYLTHLDGVSLDKYVFRSESGNGRNINRPIHRNNVEVILKKAASACGITVHVSCHTMRKTYAYHTLMQGGNTQRQLLLLQKMLNHSSALQTLTYAGITADEMKKQYEMLNLGIDENPLSDDNTDAPKEDTGSNIISSRKTISERNSTVRSGIVSISDYRRSREDVTSREIKTVRRNENIL